MTLELDTAAAQPKEISMTRTIRRYDIRYEVGKRLDRACLAIAARLPARLRMWVVVDSTNVARRLYPHSSGYAGPDGLGYSEIYDGARRERQSR